MRKDIKKSSYYVWFLGAQEAKGLRGADYVLPVVRSLVEREREVEPFKVTLQVSHKGLKIVQNVPGAAAAPGKAAAKQAGAKAAKAETVKHLIPHHAVTCVLQQEDIVACILLLYNPVTKCPVHVHAYRCDSVETAQILCGQLQTLIERPDNQKKLAEIEARLRAKGLLLPAPPLPQGPVGPASRRHAGGGSDGRSTSTRESESSGGSSSERLSGLREERVTNLYDSLAAELREKLGADQDHHAPILLPPRDYDTVHRQKGNLASVDRRRCLSAAVVGVNAKNVKNALEEQPAAANASGRGAGKRGSGGSGTQTGRAGGGALVGSSGGSSGIGSDHAPSPDNESDPRYLDNASSSDEEWNEPSEDSLFLVQPGLAGLGGRGALSGWRGSHGAAELSLPRARRLHSPAASPSPTSPSTPATPGSLTRTDSRDARDHPLAGAAPGSRRRHTSPTPPVDRHAPRDEDDDVPSRTRVRRPQADERQRARSPRTPRSPRSSPRSPRSARAARSPPRSLSPGPQQHRALATPASSGLARRGVGNHPLSGPMSPRERFQDAKEKFLSLERERLEEQERVMQLNMEKRRSSQQPQPAPQSPHSPHSPPIVEPPISPAMVAGPRPRPRPRRPSWSRSRDESDDDMLDAPLSPAGPANARYYADEDDDVDFSGNAPPMGGRQRIIAAVNRRMSRESLEDDGDDFAVPPARTTASSRPGPPRHEYPAAYRGDRADRAEHPGRGGDARSDPRGVDPRGVDPRSVDPRSVDPRGGDHRSGDHRGDPRGGDPRGGDHRGGDLRGGDLRGGDSRGVAAVSRSRSVHREDRFRSPARGSYPYPSDAMPMAALPDDHPRYRIPYNEDLDIPLERYRNALPHPHARAATAGPAAPRHAAPYPRDHDDDLAERERAYLAEKKRRSVFEALEDERRRHSNELAQEFKRRSYQELDERDRYPGLDRDTARDSGPPGPPPGHPAHAAGPPRGQVSARYRHSYAEPPPRHHDLLHRTNSAASPRVGIAAVRPY